MATTTPVRVELLGHPATVHHKSDRVVLDYATDDFSISTEVVLHGVDSETRLCPLLLALAEAVPNRFARLGFDRRTGFESANVTHAVYMEMFEDVIKCVHSVMASTPQACTLPYAAWIDARETLDGMAEFDGSTRYDRLLLKNACRVILRNVRLHDAQARSQTKVSLYHADKID